MPPNMNGSTYNLIFPKNLSWTSDQIELYQKIISFVDKLNSFHSPKIHLEQYSLPSDLIALILILVAEDLEGKNVVDLGCGTGRMTLPIQKFFSNRILGVEIDPDAIEILMHLIKTHNLKIDLLISSVEFLESFNWGKEFQTTLMNPPFGTKRRKLDLVFLKQALTFSQTVISIHKSNPATKKLITKLGKQYRRQLRIIATVIFPVFPSFPFHHKNKHFVQVDLIRLAEY
ncbi:MAG: METTL5 family protein [Candidatus Hodarchaeota archaeon]